MKQDTTSTPSESTDALSWWQLFRSMPLLAGFGDDELHAMIADATELELAPGEQLFREGSEASSVYVVRRGRLEVTTAPEGAAPRVLAQIEGGVMVGEMQMLCGGRRMASVHAVERSQLMELSRVRLLALTADNHAAFEPIAAEMVRRLRQNRVRELLPGLIGTASPSALREVEAELEPVQLEPGEVLFERGGPADALYLVIQGRLEARVDTHEGLATNEITVGQGLGEIAMLADTPRTATVVALRKCELMRMPKAAFNRIYDRYPEFARAQSRRVIEVAIDGAHTHKRSRYPDTFALVALDRDPLTRASCERLAHAIAELEGSVVLTPAVLDAALGIEGSAQITTREPDHWRLESWMESKSASQRILLLDAEPTQGAWGQRCFERAEHVVWVASAERGPARRALEDDEQGREGRARETVVLVHPEDCELPRDAAAWFELRELSALFHLRAQASAHITRIARSLVGRGVGVALSGGGALGAAHVGMLRALLEAGLPIDYVGGTSAGAAIGSLLARGWDPQQLLEAGRRLYSSNPMGRPALPLGALFSKDPIDRLLRSLHGEALIEDMWLPYFCVSANITAGKKRIHDRGLLWRAVRASISIPGVLPPMIEDGELLVDGAVLVNLPGSDMKQRCGGPLICLETSSPGNLNVNYSYAEQPSPWQVLWSRLNPFKARIEIPSMRGVMARAMMVGSHRETLRSLELADLALRPVLDGFSIQDFAAFDRLVEFGYAHACSELEHVDLQELMNASALDSSGGASVEHSSPWG